MLDKETAKERVTEFLNRLSRFERDDELIVDENHTYEADYGWIFSYQSRRYLETRNVLYARAGLLPLVVNKFDGELDFLSELYEKRLKNEVPKFYDLEFFLRKYINYPLSEEVLSYEGTIRKYMTHAVSGELKRILAQGKALLSEQPFPVERFSKLTTLPFETEEQARGFLRHIIELIESSEPYDI